jgi:hypothetical protein
MSLFEQFISGGIIRKLSETEKQDYVKFFEHTYKDNLKAAKDNLALHPRWAIIAGYYAMHDMAKLFLAKQFSLKIGEKRVHLATITALKEALKDETIQAKLVDLLEKAENIFSGNITRYLAKGRNEREKVQYYNFKTDFDKIRNNASSFLKEIAEPFIKILEDLMKND